VPNATGDEGDHMIIRWMIVGIVLWVAVAAIFRFAPEAAVSWVFMTLPAAMLLVTQLFLRVFRVAETDRGEAASIMAVPGLLVGIYAINSSSYVFENSNLTLGPQFATLMFACYAAVLMAGLVSFRVVVGFLLWIAVAVAFRFYGHLVFQPGQDGVTWTFMTLPLVLLVVTYLVLKLLRVAQTDRAEAASVLAVPGLLVGIYEVNSFSYVFPNLDPTLGPQFAALMFACFAAVIVAGIVSSRLEGI
jgi:hypothetical protein